jgi:hypothetical protein
MPLNEEELVGQAERSFGRYADASSRYDYFMMAVAAALLGYVAKDYHHPQHLAALRDFIDPAAMVCLITSFFAGAFRVEAWVALLRMQHERFASQHAVEQLKPARDRGQVLESTASGRAVDAEKARRLIGLAQTRIAKLDKAIDAATDRSHILYYPRLLGLVLGFLVLLVGRILG